MNFLRRRPLAFAISIGMLAAAAGFFLPGPWKLLPALLSIAAIFVVTAILRRRDVDEICNMPATPFLILTAVIVCCMMLTSWAFFDLYASPYDQLADGTIDATILEVRGQYSFCTTYVVRMNRLDGEKVNAKGLLTSETAIGLIPGDTFTCDVEFVPLDEFYGAFDVTTGTMLSNRYVFTCNTVGNAEFTGYHPNLEVRFTQLRDYLSAKMGLYLDYDTKMLARALLLGQREHEGKIWRDFISTGTIHLLAVSGLHLSILTGMLLEFLLRIGIGYRTRHIITVGFILFYMALLGFPLAVVRAGIMLIIAYSSFFLERRSDSITSLFLAGGLIVLCDPAAICDRGFALSFTATLGLLLFAGDARKFSYRIFGSDRRFAMLRRAFTAVTVSFGVIMFVLPLQWIYFGEVSLLSVPATLLLTPICELLLWLMPPFLIFALLGFHFLCGRLGWIITVLAGFVEILVGWMASVSPLISLRYFFAPIIIIMTVCVIVRMMLKNVESWVYALAPVTASALIYLICVQTWELAHIHTHTLDFVQYKRDEALVLVTSGESIVIDLTAGTSVSMFQVQKALKANARTSVDTLVLTHLHRKHAGSVRALCNGRMVKWLMVPEPMDDEERWYLAGILDAAEEYGLEVMSYSRESETSIRFGEVTMELAAFAEIERSVHPMVGIRFVNGDFTFAYGCGAVWENDYLWEYVSDADRLLLGRHGPLYKTPPDTLPADCMVIAHASHPILADMPGLYTTDDELPHFLLEP
ncbi:MAG: hypothetical protein E7632_09265 [Ruminococcaceae bacterium]|nr:hypothetical protein [Oscillospiraceae bacterium]